MNAIEKSVRYFWLLLLIYIGSSQILKAQDTAHVLLINHNQVDVCGSVSDRDYIISINIGEVKPTDSLFGFDFYIRYNPAKFNARAGLTINTLSQFFDNDNDVHIFRSSSDSGLIEGHYGTFSSYPAYGNKPLIAFTGRFLGSCPDTGYFRLDTLTFTSEFKKIVDVSGKFVLVKAEVLDKPNRSIAVSFETIDFKNDTVIFNKVDSVGTVKAGIIVRNNLNLENIVFELITDNSDYFKIEEIKSISDNIQIDSLSKVANGYLIYTSVTGEIGIEEIFEIKIKEIKRKGEVKELKLTPIKVNDCACIKNLIEDKTNLKGNLEDTTGTGITEFENKTIYGYYNEIKDKFIIESDKEIEEILIYNILGNLIKKINISVIDRNAEIAAEGLTRGVYLVTVRNIKDEIKNIVMIKN
ncbi:MAG: hypothetical protein A2X61_14535 [Ignavibacteria bacterium GWB2_35_12]|nr:MAG: hypothetical protein A2X63_04670 [Ignavibacteria bacterium GWA2_35_8]OGU41117.1 MAG: hypothetical protein A2X61_14535 [Ignavibacteria bacterium GWB2_35_12]OGU97229.1 MAG: hypothetical protein A2220_06015 [Ignavibacteria bacterium RIFOXYA2_FULL_35_10]OGV22933.1 MAG: hypothetical protein A2475_10695 [Ignavibacteria bacterium RIFOXYC2_FULL_35_21]